jgi:hypothetical protein
MTLTGNGSGIQVFNGNDNDIHNNKIVTNLIDVGVYHGVGILLSESGVGDTYRDRLRQEPGGPELGTQQRLVRSGRR